MDSTVSSNTRRLVGTQRAIITKYKALSCVCCVYSYSSEGHVRGTALSGVLPMRVLVAEAGLYIAGHQLARTRRTGRVTVVLCPL